METLGRDELNAINARYFSISKRRMETIMSLSACAYKLINDIPVLLARIVALQNELETARNELRLTREA